MMSLSYMKKYFIVCYLVLFIVNNAVAQLSLTEYFGTDKLSSSESDTFEKDCDTEEVQKECYEACGPNHACLPPAQCICFEDRPKEVSGEELQQEEPSEEKNTEEEVLDDTESRNKNFHVSETLHCRISQHQHKEENSNKESSEESNGPHDSPAAIPIYLENEESNSVDENLVTRPALRHHIAHFCPNLGEARACIRKCMKLDLPAFCGKDHICYCGHKYDHSVEVTKLNSDERHKKINPFRDLYEKYFGVLEPQAASE